MKTSVLITGVPGVGKSNISLAMQKLGYVAWDLEEVPSMFYMIDHKTKSSRYRDNTSLQDVKKTDWVCHKQLLQKLIADQTTDVAFYCGSSFNYEEIIPLFDSIILLKAAPETVRNRLRTRKGHLFGKTVEVQDWVISWKDWWEKKMENMGAKVIINEKKVSDVAKHIADSYSTRK